MYVVCGGTPVLYPGTVPGYPDTRTRIRILEYPGTRVPVPGYPGSRILMSTRVPGYPGIRVPSTGYPGIRIPGYPIRVPG